ncbi:uncharacterized protein G2W53_014277 [Senna tora]|uniref:Uncharacterized protein n=1 Tax=Senna tora TaxID=362788 RepID=A0A835C3W9_9FABA|nr:uncharacterized protein G2W53_014277 [Senna tora]
MATMEEGEQGLTLERIANISKLGTRMKPKSEIRA